MSAEARVKVRREDDHYVAELGGELDMSNARDVSEELLSRVGNDATGLVVDLSGVRYLDSAGISVLFMVARRLDSRRQKVALVVPPGSPLHRLLDVTRMHEAAITATTLEAGAEALRTAVNDALEP